MSDSTELAEVSLIRKRHAEHHWLSTVIVMSARRKQPMLSLVRIKPQTRDRCARQNEDLLHRDFGAEPEPGTCFT
jgi:hypothetical protein